jgi:hypothetical protein
VALAEPDRWAVGEGVEDPTQREGAASSPRASPAVRPCPVEAASIRRDAVAAAYVHPFVADHRQNRHQAAHNPAALVAVVVRGIGRQTGCRVGAGAGAARAAGVTREGQAAVAAIPCPVAVLAVAAGPVDPFPCRAAAEWDRPPAEQWPPEVHRQTADAVGPPVTADSAPPTVAPPLIRAALPCCPS